MKLIPVIDILNGVAVHAVRGKRSEYQPLKSVLCDSTDPVGVASAFKAIGFEELYVADLDAITGKGENFSVVKKIADETGLQLMVDAGASDFSQARKLFQHNVSKVIIGTETLADLSFVKRAFDCFGNRKVTVSLDLKAGKVLADSYALRSMSPLEMAQHLQGTGVGELIVLDLARVGSGEGADFSLLKELLSNLDVKVLVGGGVCSMEDLVSLRDMGVFGVLLATALHSGVLASENLKRAGLI